ncbi:Sn1-specific diacylglycerol lipase beta [Seminavis robusta]|uniref:sn-1-specific diacylglycerol lipase n=1 Tax=Seminavis robusta TaxID=568900 RepID=A0A9N8EG22_9STRA|nr:Sn1-specific diacylglycerol lipase beta [Seminavis robusta]|eukprot:Sro939_g222420.1 Sn1-specific diacylglycerol lipase beta (395) ;mRNA; f:14775-16428
MELFQPPGMADTPFIGTTTAVAAATSSTLVAVEDNRSIGVINDRIKEMLQHLEEKTQSDLNHDELLRACHALILAITTKPEFQNHKLLHVEQAIFQQQGEGSNKKISRPTTADLEELLPWLELAYFAHEYNDAGSKSQLEAAIQESTGKEWFFTQPKSSREKTKQEESFGAHEGVLASSIKLRQELQDVFRGDDILKNYSIRITGHSLVGAGAASVFALLLRAQYKELHEPGRLHAYCFAPPPVLDHPSAVRSKDFITSVANRNDCVPRLSVSNLEIMVKMLEGLNEKIMTQEGLNSCWSIAKENVVGDVMEQLLTDDPFDGLLNIMEEAQAAVEIEAGKCLSHPFQRYLEVNDRMISDHTVPAYRESLVASIQVKNSEAAPKSKSLRKKIFRL